jgi:heparin/heparan-sulfate lyase
VYRCFVHLRCWILTLLVAGIPLRAGEWMNVDGTRIPVPPSEHPRLYLQSRDLGDLQRRINHPALKPDWDYMRRHAADNVQTRLEVEAIEYLLDHNAERGKRTVAAALEALENAHYPKEKQDISRAIGRMMVTGAIVYDWCYPLLTASQKQQFIEQEVRLAKDMEVGYPPREGSYLTGHGSEWMVMRDLLSAGVALYDEFPEMYRYASKRFFDGLLPARNFWYQGHAFHQGSAYAETRVSAELYPLFIFDRMGFPNIYSPEQQFLPYSWIYMRRPDGQLLRSGDGQSKAPKLRSLLIASYYKDGYILADYLKTPGVDDKLFELLWRDPDLQPKPIEELPLSHYMESPYGWMVARTGWDAESVIAEMKVNVFNFTNHQHLDAGAFQLYYKGPLAIDSGLYEGSDGAYGSPHHKNYYQRTIAHNSLLVYDPEEKFTRGGTALSNDGGQRLPNGWSEPNRLDTLLTRGYKTGEVLAHDFGPDPKHPSYTYLKGDITQAYSSKVRQVQRSFVFLNLEKRSNPAALIVFDRVVAANPAFKKVWLLHSMEEPAIREDATETSLTERGWNGKLFTTTLLPEKEDREITKIGGPGKEFFVDGVNYPNQPRGGDPKDFETGAWRIELSPRRPAETSYFLNVLQVTDAAGSALSKIEKNESKDTIAVRVGEFLAVFRKDGLTSPDPVTFSTSGPGATKCLVTGLAQGSWRAWRAGKPAGPATTISAGQDSMFFSGPAGRYECRKEIR